MIDPVTGTALVGMGWFGNRLLGPTADVLGEQLKIFATARWEKIFRRAEEINGGREVTELPPAFSYVALQKAALSEDENIITDMWANLLLSAASNFNQTHISFVEILGQLGSNEVVALNELVDESLEFSNPARMPVTIKPIFRDSFSQNFRAVTGKNGESVEDMISKTQQLLNTLKGTGLGWPGRITLVRYPYSNLDLEKHGAVVGGESISLSYDILLRQRLLEFFSFDLNQSFSSPYIEGVLVSTLGVEFVLTCRGQRS